MLLSTPQCVTHLYVKCHDKIFGDDDDDLHSQWHGNHDDDNVGDIENDTDDDDDDEDDDDDDDGGDDVDDDAINWNAGFHRTSNEDKMAESLRFPLPWKLPAGLKDWKNISRRPAHRHFRVSELLCSSIVQLYSSAQFLVTWFWTHLKSIVTVL